MGQLPDIPSFESYRSSHSAPFSELRNARGKTLKDVAEIVHAAQLRDAGHAKPVEELEGIIAGAEAGIFLLDESVFHHVIAALQAEVNSPLVPAGEPALAPVNSAPVPAHAAALGPRLRNVEAPRSTASDLQSVQRRISEQLAVMTTTQAARYFGMEPETFRLFVAGPGKMQRKNVEKLGQGIDRLCDVLRKIHNKSPDDLDALKDDFQQLISMKTMTKKRNKLEL